MRAKVVDASVLGALAFGEPRADEAVNLLQGAPLHAPTLLGYEMASIARRKSRLLPECEHLIADALAEALRLDIEWWEVDHAAARALGLELDLTTCDASYLYLARLMGAELVTFDQKLGSAARRQPG